MTVALRPPSQVMKLARMGAMFQTRLSFMRSLIRRMAGEGWTFGRPRFDLDAAGHGLAVYTVDTGSRVYSLVAFSQALAPERRTDRVIAEAWDATFNLVDGPAEPEDLERLAANTPKQEAGRFSARELVLARANKSVRLFEHVVDSLAAGKQPSLDRLAAVGYLMRTTAVYGSGKFGCADRDRIADRPETAGAFQAEMLTVYLIRQFTIDLANHVAATRGGDGATRLAPGLARFLGIGNATGLGMAPFLSSHPVLLHNWVLARETALARVRALRDPPPDTGEKLRELVARARIHLGEWRVEDRIQSERIAVLETDLERLQSHLSRWTGGLDGLYLWGEETLSLECQELLVSILLEPFGWLVDDLADRMHADRPRHWRPGMSIDELRALIEVHFAWALDLDFSQDDQAGRFWYYSEEKLEPRLGGRREDPLHERREMPLALARDVTRLYRDLAGATDDQPIGDFVRAQPEHRFAARRVQTVAACPYAEIRDNLIGAGLRPIDMLRFKLALFGASKFDPKSDLWTRITLYQGAPLAEDLGKPDADPEALDGWLFPIRAEAAP